MWSLQNLIASSPLTSLKAFSNMWKQWQTFFTLYKVNSLNVYYIFKTKAPKYHTPSIANTIWRGGGANQMLKYDHRILEQPKRLLYLQNWREIIFEGGLVSHRICENNYKHFVLQVQEYHSSEPALKLLFQKKKGSSYPSADRLYVNKYKIIIVARVIFRQHFQ